MTEAILGFFAAIALIALAMVGIFFLGLIFMGWLEGEGLTPRSGVAESAEAEIDRLKEQTFTDMFDVARDARFEAHADQMDPGPEEPPASGVRRF